MLVVTHPGNEVLHELHLIGLGPLVEVLNTQVLLFLIVSF